MLSFTLIVMISAGYDFQKSPAALSSFTVPGFTTEQACVNAANKVFANQLKGWDSTDMRTKAICVANDI